MYFFFFFFFFSFFSLILEASDESFLSLPFLHFFTDFPSSFPSRLMHWDFFNFLFISSIEADCFLSFFLFLFLIFSFEEAFFCISSSDVFWLLFWLCCHFYILPYWLFSAEFFIADCFLLWCLLFLPDTDIDDYCHFHDWCRHWCHYADLIADFIFFFFFADCCHFFIVWLRWCWCHYCHWCLFTLIDYADVSAGFTPAWEVEFIFEISDAYFKYFLHVIYWDAEADVFADDTALLLMLFNDSWLSILSEAEADADEADIEAFAEISFSATD